MLPREQNVGRGPPTRFVYLEISFVWPIIQRKTQILSDCLGAAMKAPLQSTTTPFLNYNNINEFR